MNDDQRANIIEWMQATLTGPLTREMLDAIGWRGDEQEATSAETDMAYEVIVNDWLKRHPDPENTRLASTTGMTNRDVLEQARDESRAIRKLARRTLAEIEIQFEFERWQWDLIADLYLRISALDDLLNDASRIKDQTP